MPEFTPAFATISSQQAIHKQDSDISTTCYNVPSQYSNAYSRIKSTSITSCHTADAWHSNRIYFHTAEGVSTSSNSSAKCPATHWTASSGDASFSVLATDYTERHTRFSGQPSKPLSLHQFLGFVVHCSSWSHGELSQVSEQ